jgi:hypothetical protein
MVQVLPERVREQEKEVVREEQAVAEAAWEETGRVPVQAGIVYALTAVKQYPISRANRVMASFALNADHRWPENKGEAYENSNYITGDRFKGGS